MPSVPPVPRANPAPALRLGWGGWLRCLLILLLVLDQVGAPLHHHRHDSGVDGFAWRAAAVVSGGEVVLRASSGDGSAASVFHAATALRAEARAVLGRVSAHLGDLARWAQGADDPLPAALLASLVLLWAAMAGAGPRGAPRRWAVPRSLFRSLPPANRAPPHAA